MSIGIHVTPGNIFYPTCIAISLHKMLLGVAQHQRHQRLEVDLIDLCVDCVNNASS